MSYFLSDTRVVPPNQVQQYWFDELQIDGDDNTGFFIEGFSITASVSDETGKTTSIQLFVGSCTIADTEGGGWASVNGSWTALGGTPGNGKNFEHISLPCGAVFNDGFWQGSFTVLGTQSPAPAINVTYEISVIAFTTADAMFVGDAPPNGAPSNGERQDVGDETTLTWQDNSTDELGFKIERDDGQIRYVPANITTYVDPTGAGHSYLISAFKGDGTPENSGITEPELVPGPELNLMGTLIITIELGTELHFMTDIITIVGNINIDISSLSPMVYLVDPSGIYTLVPNQKHDALYERGGVITSQNIKIPDPFFKTGFIGDQPSGEY